MILTDEDIKAIYDNEKGGDYYDTVWAIEAAILEKLISSEPVAEHVCALKRVADSWLVEAKYNELLLAVQRKFPDETRHETALRYIKTAEAPSYTNAARSEK